MEYRTLNPATGELLETFEPLDDEQVDLALQASMEAFGSWRSTSFAARADILNRAADALESEAETHALAMAIEMGKPIAQGAAELAKCAWVCRYYATNAEQFLAPSARTSDGSSAYVRPVPIGPVLAIMPWNFPYWQVFRFAAPALMAGNTVLLKHAPSTPRAARAIERLLRGAGVPEPVFQSLFLDDEQAARVIEDGRVRGVSLTGSTRAGREVAAVAGGALKPLVVELGGSDPFMVFADADLDAAVRQGVASRCLNSGQSCIAAKRFLIDRSIYHEFVERFVATMESQTVGAPEDNPDIGPLARADLRDTLAEQVALTIADGARALCGGAPLDGPGFFYPPTVIVDHSVVTPPAQQELFGPVAAISAFATEGQAVALANSTVYGLAASIWTSDEARVERLVTDVDAGSIFVNGLVKSDPRLPFGGFKRSGYGRELGREGILEFTNRKTVWIA